MKGKPTRGKAVDVEKALELYKDGFSMNEIGKRLGHCHGVIAYHIHKSGIPIVKSRLTKPEVPTDKLIEMYNEGMSTIEIGEKVNLSAQAVYSRLFKANVKLRSFSEAIKLSAKRGRCNYKTGEQHPTWKGGVYKDKSGYTIIRKEGRDIPEHRLVWEKYNGKIPEGYIVHHFNGDRADNRIKNLIAIPRKRHSPTMIVDKYRERIIQLEKELTKIQKEAK